MARMVSRSRPREGRGLGEVLSEYIAFIIIGIALIGAGYWYFMIYQKSPTVAIQRYMSALNSGNVDAQYGLITNSAKGDFGNSKDNYDDKCSLAHGLAARIANVSISNMKDGGDKAEADVSTTVRKAGQELIQASSDSYNDHFILRKEADGWKVDLHASFPDHVAGAARK